MFNGLENSGSNGRSDESIDTGLNTDSKSCDALLTIDEVQKTLNRSRASVYRYTNTDTRNLNPPYNPKKLNTEFRSCLLYTSDACRRSTLCRSRWSPYH